MGRNILRPATTVVKPKGDSHEQLEELTMIDNRASLRNSTDTIATFVTDVVDLMLELEIREIAPEKVVGFLPVMTQIIDSSIGKPRLRVLYRTSQTKISMQTTHND